MVRSWSQFGSVVALAGMLGTTLVASPARSAPSSVSPTAFSQAESTVTEAPSVPGSVRGALPPAAALGVGLGATIVPTMLAYGMTSKDSRAEDIGLFVGVASGVIAGPALGLWSGGRGDLAKRGLIIRSVGTALALGAMGVASATWEGGSQDPALTTMLAVVGVIGGGAAAGSWFHDIAIIPSATAQGANPRAGLVVRPDGLLALSVRF